MTKLATIAALAGLLGLPAIASALQSSCGWNRPA